MCLCPKGYVNDSTITNVLGVDYCNIFKMNLILFGLVFLKPRSICGNGEFCKLLLSLPNNYSQALQTFENTSIKSYKSFGGKQ